MNDRISIDKPVYRLYMVTRLKQNGLLLKFPDFKIMLFVDSEEKQIRILKILQLYKVEAVKFIEGLVKDEEIKNEKSLTEVLSFVNGKRLYLYQVV